MVPDAARREPNQLLGCCFALLPVAFGHLDDEALLDGAGGHAHVAHFAIDDGFDPLKVWEKPAFGNGGDVCADAALFLGLAAAPNNAALHGALSSQFTNSSH